MLGRWLLTVSVFLVALPGCGGGGSPTTLTVFAAASLTPAFTRIGTDFQAANPGAVIVFDFGSSADLEAQIESEGVADVFASASESIMEELSRTVGVSDRADFVRNQLVIITPPGDPASIRSLQDLAKPDVKVLLAAPGVPVGDYARRALEAAGIREAVLANVVSNEEDDASLVAKIVAGEADAAIVYTSDVSGKVAPRVRAVPLPASDNVVATYPIAVVDGTDRPELARAFVDYVTGPAGRATLATFGFLPPPS